MMSTAVLQHQRVPPNIVISQVIIQFPEQTQRYLEKKSLKIPDCENGSQTSENGSQTNVNYQILIKKMHYLCFAHFIRSLTMVCSKFLENKNCMSN